MNQTKLTIGLWAISLLLCGSKNLHAEWSTPTQISSGPASIDMNNTPLVIDLNSIASVGWLDSQEVAPNLDSLLDFSVFPSASTASLFPSSKAWTPPSLMYAHDLSSGNVLLFPSLNVDRSGSVSSVFSLAHPTSPLANVLYASTFDRRLKKWSTPIAQLSEGIADAGSSKAGDLLDNLGVLLSTSLTGTPPPFNLQFIRFPADSDTWLSPISLGTNDTAPSATAIKIVNGRAVMAWKSSSPLQIQSMQYDYASAMSSVIVNIPIPENAVNINSLALATCERGISTLIYAVQFPDTTTALYANILELGENQWSEPFLISDPDRNIRFNGDMDIAGSIAGSIVMDRFGNSMIVWAEEVSPTQSFMRAVCFPQVGIPIGYVDLTDPNANGQVSLFSAVGDPMGNAIATWVLTVGGESIVQVASRPTCKFWSPPITLSTTGTNPMAALSEQETAVVVWIDTVTGALVGSREQALFTLPQPSNLTSQLVKNKFLTQKNYTLTLKWDKGIAPNITSYQVLKNDQVVAVVPGNQTYYTFPPMPHQRGNYSVVAIASNGNRSRPIWLELY